MGNPELLHSVLCFRRFPTLPLQIVRRVSATVLQGLNVIDHVTSAWPFRRASTRTGIVVAEGALGRRAQGDPATCVAGTGLAASRGSRVRSDRLAARSFSPAGSPAWAGSPRFGGQEQGQDRQGKADQALSIHNELVGTAFQSFLFIFAFYSL